MRKLEVNKPLQLIFSAEQNHFKRGYTAKAGIVSSEPKESFTGIATEEIKHRKNEESIMFGYCVKVSGHEP